MASVETPPKVTKPLKVSPSSRPAEHSAKQEWSRDEWKRGPNCWIRLHNRPRRAMFIPTGTQNGPELGNLSGERTTYVHWYGHGSSSDPLVITDHWTSLGDQTQILDHRWTGTTVFPDLKKKGSAPAQVSIPDNGCTTDCLYTMQESMDTSHEDWLPHGLRRLYELSAKAVRESYSADESILSLIHI